MAERLTPLCAPGYTYFYRGAEYWSFDNQKLRVEPGYPRSILRDWMGCDQTEPGRSGGTGNRGDRQLSPDDLEVTIDDVPPTVNAVAVVIPCILALCVLVLLYTIFQFKHKGAPQGGAPPRSGCDSAQEWV